MSTPRTTTTRVSERSRALLGLAATLTLAGLLALAYTGAYRSVGAPDHQTVRAVFADTSRLKAEDPVRIDGIDVGKVKQTGADAGDDGATVVMQVDRSADPLYGNATAAIKWRTLLGGAFVVDLDRGTPRAGPLGSRVIPLRRTSTQVELQDLISFNRGRARTGLQHMPGELARGLGDADGPARLLRTLDDVAPDVARGLGATRGEHPGNDLRSLVASSARTVRALDTPTGDIERVVTGTATTLQAIAARQDEVRRAITTAPGVMHRTELTAARLDTTLRLADPLVARLRDSAAQIAPTLRALRPTVAGTEQLLRRARPLVRPLRPALSALAATARDGAPLLDDLAPSVGRFDKTILPFMGEIDAQTEHSATQMIGPAFAALGPGVTAPFDRNGHFLRFPAALGPNSVQTVPCQPLVTNPDATAIAACEALQNAIQEYFTYSPIGPAPGTSPTGRSRK